MSVSLMWLVDGIAALPANDVHVSDLTLHSREVRTGSLFLALRGHRSHGLEHAADAAARGASAVLWDPEGAPEWARGAAAGMLGAAWASAANATPFAAPVVGLNRLAGRLADRFFGFPSAHLRIVGITGTNGKTTCAYLIAQCLNRLGFDAAYIGTLGWGRVGSLRTVMHTTPDVVSLHRQLSALHTLGVREVAMEVSSHALDQGRVDGVRFHSAAFTNLTRDHLDYHSSMQAYGAAKARLFEFVGLEHIVINIDDAFGRNLAGGLSGRLPLTLAWVGGAPGQLADRALRIGDRVLYAEDLALDLRGLSMAIGGSFGTQRIHAKLVGRFNAENAVLVMACLAGLSVPLADAAMALAGCAAAPGRMEVIESPTRDKPLAVIDYAHTPDALAHALRALREHCPGALWCVFGCGGDRDAGKRPLMGAIADELADHIIVTDDNPRSEDPQSIARGIVTAIHLHSVRIVHDRSAAIAAALNEAAPEDMVLIAGKGHEEYQIYGTARREFSDRYEARRCLGVAA